MRLVLGVNSGGSKTHALVADERGQALGFASSGRSNWEDTGLEQAGVALKEAVCGALAAAAAAPGDLAASAFGLAGLDWDEDRPVLGALIVAGPVFLRSDDLRKDFEEFRPAAWSLWDRSPWTMPKVSASRRWTPMVTGSSCVSGPEAGPRNDSRPPKRPSRTHPQRTLADTN